MNHHVHVAGLFILTVIAINIASHYLVRTVAANHSDNPVLSGLAYNL